MNYFAPGPLRVDGTQYEFIGPVMEFAKDSGAWGLLLLLVLFIVVLFLMGIPFYWAAKTLRVYHSTVGKGLSVAFFSLIISVVGGFLPETWGTLLVIFSSIALVMIIFQTSLGISIGVNLLSIVYSTLLVFVIGAIGVGIWLLIQWV